MIINQNSSTMFNNCSLDVQSVYKTKTYVGEHNKRGSTCLPFQIMLKTLYIYEWSDTEINTNHKYSLHQKFCLDYCWDQKNVNLNYEEHCGYVNFLVESNWSLKGEGKQKQFTTYVFKEITRTNSKEAKSREGISSTCITTSIKRKGFQETHTRISSVAYKVKLPLTLQLQ